MTDHDQNSSFGVDGKRASETDYGRDSVQARAKTSRRDQVEQFSYRAAGVDIDAGARAVELMKQSIAGTMRPGVMGNVGGFGGLFSLKEAGAWRDPVLVSGADGVGTKLKIAFATGIDDTIGIDCVAMNVNDILVAGAEPLFFLDYLAVGKLNPEQAANIVRGVAEGCRRAGCALLGGETAEMPSLYRDGEYDLAGFAVGIVEREQMRDSSRVRVGDAVIGLPSSGLHSNGYSLARAVLLERAQLRLDEHIDELGCTLGEEMLRPTAIYSRPVLGLLRSNLGDSVHAMAHITGGGLVDNPVRSLPSGTRLVLRRDSWKRPPIFDLIERLGAVDRAEMERVFNNGIGMLLTVAAEDADAIVRFLHERDVPAVLCGEVVAGSPGAAPEVKLEGDW